MFLIGIVVIVVIVGIFYVLIFGLDVLFIDLGSVEYLCGIEILK